MSIALSKEIISSGRAICFNLQFRWRDSIPNSMFNWFLLWWVWTHNMPHLWCFGLSINIWHRWCQKCKLHSVSVHLLSLQISCNSPSIDIWHPLIPEMQTCLKFNSTLFTETSCKPTFLREGPKRKSWRRTEGKAPHCNKGPDRIAFGEAGTPKKPKY